MNTTEFTRGSYFNFWSSSNIQGNANQVQKINSRHEGKAPSKAELSQSIKECQDKVDRIGKMLEGY